MIMVLISELQDTQQKSNDGNQQAQINISPNSNSNNQPNTDEIHLNIQNHERNNDNSADDAP